MKRIASSKDSIRDMSAFVRKPLIGAGLALLVASGCDASFSDKRGDTAPQENQNLEDDFMGTAGLVAEGTFEGLSGYIGEGTAQLFLNDDGSFSLRFGDDFRSDGRIPGPVVFITNREDLNREILPEQGDLRLGELDSISGAQEYALPVGDGGRRVAWVYCEPFDIEVGRAIMTDVN